MATSSLRVWLRRKTWRSRVALREWWMRQRAPWPIVGECHKDYIPDHSCEQCQPTHVHVWKAWAERPDWHWGPYGVPVRCTVCGARKCDVANCDSRRHDHIHTHGLALPHIKEPKVGA